MSPPEMIANFQKSSPTLKTMYLLEYKILWNAFFPVLQTF